MDKIQVLDDFLTEDELTNVKKIMKNKKWEYYHTSNGVETDTYFWTVYLNDEKYFSEYIKNIIELHFSKKFELVRVYANGQTFGQNGSYHIDTNEPDSYTFCLYINDIEKQDVDLACGYIFFKFPELNYKICYEPLNNRGILFPSNYIHRADAFSRFIKTIRICIAFKLKEIKDV